MTTISLTEELIKEANEGHFYWNIIGGEVGKAKKSIRSISVVNEDEDDTEIAPGNFYSKFNKTVDANGNHLPKSERNTIPDVEDIIWCPDFLIMGYTKDVKTVIKNNVSPKKQTKVFSKCHTIDNYFEHLQDEEGLGGEIRELQEEAQNRRENLEEPAVITIEQVLLLGVSGNMKKGIHEKFSIKDLGADRLPLAKEISTYERLKRVAVSNQKIFEQKEEKKGKKKTKEEKRIRYEKYFVISKKKSDLIDVLDKGTSTRKQITDADGGSYQKTDIEFLIMYNGKEISVPLPIFYPTEKPQLLVQFIDEADIYPQLVDVANKKQLKKALE